MKIFMALLLVLSLAPAAYGDGGGDGAGNGGGVAEQNTMFAYLNLEKYLDLCLQSTACGLTRDEQVNLGKIRDAAPMERNFPQQIDFESERQDPGFFIIDGVERVAKTGSAIGDKIFVNKDLLYPTDASGKTQPFDIPSAVAMLAHEMGHHVGLSGDLVELDLMGAKVQALLRQDMHVASLYPNDYGLIATAIDFELTPYSSELFVTDGFTTKDFSAGLEKVLVCSPIDGKPAKFVKFDLWNLHWSMVGWTYDTGQGGLTLPANKLIGQINLDCSDGDADSFEQFIVVATIPLKAATDPNAGQFADFPALYQVQSCSDNPLNCE